MEYTVELSIKYATELTMAKIGQETKEKLESSTDFNEDAADVYFELEDIVQGIVMNINSFYDSDTFSLVVKDEDDNEVWSTNDPSSIKLHPYYYDNDDEVPAPNFEYFPLKEGDYLAKNNEMKWCTITFTIEADSFDPSKLAFYPSSCFDYYLCEDDIHLCQLAYDGHLIKDRDWDYNDNYQVNYTLIHYDGQFSDSFRLD